ncbi:sensor domain-containing protein [Francisella tularensis]|uniref:sensor domain-containing protein n=1 Tax=Francisella tularensis TaxID=263 RepID=UPI001C0F1A19|nr:EAL domain-containing protein [Francisella tularensis]MBK2108803.1 EAL domain-containing protein [Francisella tularensis subsp. novicida FSC595]
MIKKSYDWLDNLNWSALIVDFYGQIKFANSSSRDVFGFELVHGLNVINTIPGIKDFWEEFVAAPSSKNIFHYSLNDITYLLTFTQLDNDNAIFISLVNVQRLNHEHTTKEQSLFESQTPSLFFVLDMNGHLVYANYRFYKIVSGNSLSNYFDKSSEVWLNTLNVQRSHTIKIVKEKINTSYGTRTFLSQKFPIYDKAKTIIGVGSVSIDISTIEKIDKDKEIADYIVNNSDDSVMVTDQYLNIIYVNKAFEVVTGYTKTEALGNTPAMLSSRKHDKYFYERMWTKLKSQGAWEGEIWNRRKSGELYLTWAKILTVKKNSQVIYYVSVETDISKRRIRLDEIEKYAYQDMLTGLFNRYYFESHISDHIEKGARQIQPFTLMFLDLDRFKEVNDVYGHQAGDKLLISVSNRLKELVREKDLVARLGGDEFLLFFVDMTIDNAIKKANKVVEYIAKPYDIDDKQFIISASIGVVNYPQDGTDFEHLLKYADAAMYRAKDLGRNRFFLYNQEISDKVCYDLKIKQALNDAFENTDYIQVLFQLQYDLKQRQIYGIEILSRINHPDLGVVCPKDFIPILQSINQMPSFDKIVLQKACQQISSNDMMLEQNFRISQNVTVPVIMSEQYCREFIDIIKQYKISPQRFSFEVIENIAIDDYKTACKNFCLLKKEGISVEIDDFGSGYSSLSYLAQFPITVLKIDSFFVQNIHHPREEKICRAIISLAESLNLKVIAEGVETKHQADTLYKMGCYLHQGFLYSQPLSYEELLLKFKNHTSS